MNFDNILSESKEIVNPLLLMGTTATHRLGDVSSDVPDIFVAKKEHDNYWVGNWLTGFGLFDVIFPKQTSRELNESERDYYKNRLIQISDHKPNIIID